MKAASFAAAVMVAGLALMLGGPLAAGLVPGETFWTDEDQRAYQDASVAFHDASYGGGHDHSSGEVHTGPADAEAREHLSAAKEKFEREKARLVAAQSKRGWMAFAFRAAGVILAAVGVAIFWQARRNPAMAPEKRTLAQLQSRDVHSGKH